MIFVTVGSSEKGLEFDRLIQKMDQLAPSLPEPIIMQIGSSSYEPRYTSFFRYASFQEVLEYFRKAKLVVGHCGCGTILNSLEANVPLIVVPRLFSQGEIDRDGHQQDLAEKLEKRRGVKVVREIDELERAVREMLNQPVTWDYVREMTESRRPLLEELRGILERTVSE